MRHSIVIRLLLRAWMGIFFITCFCFEGLALTNAPIFSQFQFNFITPGARATAMGGAFVGLADDATAVEANPAGLTILTIPEVSIEMKHLAYTAEQLYENPPREENADPETGVPGGNITKRLFDNSVESVSFLSVVYPYNQIVFSLYRQELVKYESSYRTSPEFIVIPGTFLGIDPIESSVNLAVTNYGVGMSFRLHETFSLAISPRWSSMRMEASSCSFQHSPTDFSEDDVGHCFEINDGDSAFSFNAGVLWDVHPKISVGAVYRSGPTFTVTAAEFGPRLVTQEYNPDVTEFTLNVSDVYGAGMTVRAFDFLIFTFDVLHIRYKDLLDDFDIVAEPEAFTSRHYTIDDVIEYHCGTEYLLDLGERYLALRAGFYTVPDHTIRFTGTTGDQVYDIVGNKAFPGDELHIHITGGLGLVVNERLQIDTAADVARRFTQLSISAVYRF